MTKIQEEIWESVAGYEGKYEVSNSGKVRTIERIVNQGGRCSYRRRGKELSQGNDKDGYKLLCLHDNGNKRTFKVHRLVGIAFIPNPENKPEINHKDTIKNNNCVTNLEWVTTKENVAHAEANGLRKYPGPINPPRGSANGSSKLTEADVIKIKALLPTVRQKVIAAMFGVNQQSISGIKMGISWRHVESF